MNKTGIWAGAVVCAAVVVAAVWFAIFRFSEPVVVVTGPSAATVARPVAPVPAEPATSAMDDVASSAVPPDTATTVPAVPSRLVPAAETSVIGDRDILDDRDLRALLKEFGGWEALYRAGTEQERAELVVALGMEDKLRDELPNILPLEPDSDMRAMMLHRVAPKDYYEDLDPDTDVVDHELIALLELDLGTPLEKDEWLARLDLASIAQGEYGVEWTRRALRSGDPDVEFLAAVLQVNLNKLTDVVSPAEARRAEDRLFETLGPESDGEWDVMQRIRGYQALMFSSDPDRTLEFYRERLSEERDPRGTEALGRFIETLESVYGS